MTDAYREMRYHSIIHDREMARLSMADAHGAEFFAIVETVGKRWRDRREVVLDQIADAIERGDRPGEVTIDHDRLARAAVPLVG